jgi:hypothetical protein
MSTCRTKPRKMTECQIIAAGVERSNIHPLWKEAILHECSTAKRYSAVRVALAVQAAIQLARDVAASEEYSRAIRKGPRGRRPITPIIG